MLDLLTTKEQQHKSQQKRFGSGIRRRRETPTIYRLTTGRLSEDTKKIYTYYINDFLAFYKIIDLHGIEPLKEYSPKLIRQMVLDFVLHLRDVRKVSRSSIKLQCAALSRFFYTIRDDDARLDWTKVKDEFPPNENIRRDRGYTVEEIRRMLSKGCSGRLREKAIILILTSTGMRLGGIHPLVYGDLSPKQTPQGRVYQIQVYSGSSASYYCYCNVETADAIDDYLKDRTGKGEVLQNDSPLFRDLRMLNTKKVKPISSYNVKYIVGRVVERSGIRNTFQFSGEAARSKGFRKRYKTEAEISGMKPINVEMTHGHSTGISDHYYKPSASQVLEDYMTHAAGALSIDPTQRLEQENHDLKTIQAQELDQIKGQLHEIKRTLYRFPWFIKKTGMSKEEWYSLYEEEQKERSGLTNLD